MKDVKRLISTGFWNDDKVLNDFSPEDKYFMLYLLCNPYTTQLGVYHLPLKKAALELGYSLEAVNTLIDRFEHKYKIIKFNRETSEVAIKNYLLHSIVRGGKPVADCLEKDLKGVKDISLVGYVIDHLSKMEGKNINDTVLSFLEKHKDIHNDNDNDNDNERYVNESYNESSKIAENQQKLDDGRIANDTSTNRGTNRGTNRRSSKQKKDVRHKYGTYQNVLLSDEDMEKLKVEFPADYEDRIERVSMYCKSKGKSYSDYLATIRNWARRENNGKSESGTRADVESDEDLQRRYEQVMRQLEEDGEDEWA